MQPQKNPYDFILDPQAPKKGAGIPIATSGTKKIVMIVGFLAGILVVLIIAFNIFLSLGKADNSDLIRLQAYQVELSRVIDLGLKDSADPTLRNKLTTLRATLSTDQSAIADLLEKRNETVTKLQLASKKDEKTDEALEAAKQSGNFDSALDEAVNKLSSEYYKELKAAFADTASEEETRILETTIDNLEITSQKQ